MVVFPNAKINLGLHVTSRRPDGYHNLDMVMVPVGWRDVLEIVPSRCGKTTLTVTGNHVGCPMEKNLVYKAWKALNASLRDDVPPVDIYLHKVIPDGAGLGGGSADAAFTLTALNRLFELGLSDTELCRIAASIGADCPFFICNRPMHCRGIGDVMSPVEIDFGRHRHIAIVKQRGLSVSTAEAYGGVTPHEQTATTAQTVSLPVEQWRDALSNDFERHILAMKPEISAIKHTLYDNGAAYASMSGSGSAVYGLFDSQEAAMAAIGIFTDCDSFVEEL